MTTEQMPAHEQPQFVAQQIAPQEPLRMLTISANLLPDEILAGRRGRRVRAVVGVAMVGVVGLLGAWYGLSVTQTMAAQTALDQANDSVRAVKDQQKQYAELIQTRQDLTAIEGQLGTLMATDIQWYTLVKDVRTALPKEVSLVNIVASTASDSTSTTSGSLPLETAAEQIGTMTLTGSADDKDKIADFADNLREVEGVSDPYVTSVTLGDGSEEFAITLNLTDPLLDGRFTPQETATPGGN
ncbi:MULTISPECIES: PilN domain-containing protein [Catenuloplanes]|uniref:Tfp pilus assembly protein PilN n=1 Tax=Catenuloplanes niger TaxID=587534 RepID=A0AAE3ZX03_9ACTN|nr:PilN domain-containing protein [Catenuloplanes niger]MDR7326390.1 Tfp pilus assembly protein PilN [Catenuloplanes niger]